MASMSPTGSAMPPMAASPCIPPSPTGLTRAWSSPLLRCPSTLPIASCLSGPGLA
ncbi:uncharacterized protein CTRU02_215527 [Colletotrichum truncatum]|uniref:Uncharacterized protein n=1 Tax=Colletotrichum truncatum TaxID=5467 RepID=A0ACC3YCQ0_COLTU